MKNAIAFVNEVIVIEEPDSFRPSIILCSTDSHGSVASIADERTNISSTPIPINKNGKSEWMPPILCPKYDSNPTVAQYERVIQKRVTTAASDLKCTGLKLPINSIQYKATSPIDIVISSRSFFISLTNESVSPLLVYK